MKNYLYYFALILLLLSCTADLKKPKIKPLSKIISVVVDPTDARVYWPPADRVLALYHCKETPYAEFIMRIREITDKRLSPITTHRLANALSMESENTNDDPQFREKNVIAFYRTVRNSFNEFYSRVDTSSPMSNSECYRTICSELAFLSASKCDEKEMIVTSDLMENSNLFNSYKESIDTTSLVVVKLNKENVLPEDLHGITVIFLFDPKDRKEDQNFSKMSAVYEELLQSRGATVLVKANL